MSHHPPPPKKKTKLKIAPSKGQHPHKVFSYYSHQIIIKNICEKFHKKPNGSQEIEKKYHKTDQKIPQKSLQERRNYCEKKFSAVGIAVIQKTSLQTFLRQGLTALNKYRNSSKMSCKIIQNNSAEVFKL